MFQCRDCGERFTEARIYFEKSCDQQLPAERMEVCPKCGSLNYAPINTKHCRCCGVRLRSGKVEYCCEHCRIRGEKMWEKERIRRKASKQNPILSMTAEVEAYNRVHGTDYTYGQYVAMLFLREEKINDRQ